MNKSEDLTSSGDVDFAFEQDWSSASQVQAHAVNVLCFADSLASSRRPTWTT
jgi:hypothetical protein